MFDLLGTRTIKWCSPFPVIHVRAACIYWTNLESNLFRKSRAICLIAKESSLLSSRQLQNIEHSFIFMRQTMLTWARFVVPKCRSVYDVTIGLAGLMRTPQPFSILLILCILLVACTTRPAPGSQPAARPTEAKPAEDAEIETAAPAAQQATVATTSPPEAAATPSPQPEAVEPLVPEEEAPVDILSGAWEQGASMPSARSEMPAVALDGRIYVPGGFGGETTLEAYDPAANTWQVLADMPARRHHLMAAGHNGRLYVFGGAQGPGWGPTSTTWAYDPEIDTWTDLAPMPEARLAGAAVALGNHLYVVGGTGGTQSLLRYDPASDAWSTLAAPRFGCLGARPVTKYRSRRHRRDTSRRENRCLGRRSHPHRPGYACQR
jgi:hypothetical protein